MHMRKIILATATIAVAGCGVEPASGIDVVGDPQPALQSRFRASFDASRGVMSFEELPLEPTVGGLEREQALLGTFQAVNVAGAGRTPDTFVVVSNSSTLGAGALARSGGNGGFVAQGQPGVVDSCGGNVNQGVWRFGINVENRLDAALNNIALRIDSFTGGVNQFCHRRNATQLTTAMPGGQGVALYQYGPLADGEIIDSNDVNFANDGQVAARFTGPAANFTFEGSVFAEVP